MCNILYAELPVPLLGESKSLLACKSGLLSSWKTTLQGLESVVCAANVVCWGAADCILLGKEDLAGAIYEALAFATAAAGEYFRRQ